MKRSDKAANHAAYLAAKTQGNLHFGRTRVGRPIDKLKSKANKSRLACRGKMPTSRSITIAAI